MAPRHLPVLLGSVRRRARVDFVENALRYEERFFEPASEERFFAQACARCESERRRFRGGFGIARDAARAKSLRGVVWRRRMRQKL